MRTKLLKAICMTVLLFGLAQAQNLKVLELQAGYLNPKGTRAAGLILDGGYGITIDERVDIGLGVGVFHKAFSKETEVTGGKTGAGSQVDTKMQLLAYSTTLVPITANVTVHIPFQPPLGLYLGGSLAYEFLFDKYTNNETKASEKSNFRGFGWMTRAGIDWTIGSRSSVTLEAFLNKCKVKGDKKEIEGIPNWKEVDVSGLGFRAGFRLILY